MNKKAFGIMASAGQILALFPFIVTIEGISYYRYNPLHYAALFACFAIFYALGRLAAAYAHGAEHTILKKGWALFLSRAAVLVPAGVFCVLVAVFGLSSGFYIYILPACFLAYYGGHHTYSLSYSDTFTTAWVVIYFTGAIISSVLLWFTHREELYAAGVFQLCLVFGGIIVLSAVLANQTNIDVCTAQRSGGRAVLPNGLRSYNMLIISVVSIIIVGLFLFAKPLAELIAGGLAALVRLLLSLVKDSPTEAPELENEAPSGEMMGLDTADNPFSEILRLLFLAMLVVFIIRFRRQIWEAIKEFFAPMFRESAKPEKLPYIDEVTDFAVKQNNPRSRKKQLMLLLKRYREERDPRLKYRVGYAIFLHRLSDTPFARLPQDTTTIHRKKGESAFRREGIAEMVEVYNGVRYGDLTPTTDQLAALEGLLDEINNTKNKGERNDLQRTAE